MPIPEAYQVRLDAFHGPLDLLLYLIRQAEVDIQDVPIAQITDQYLHFLDPIDDIDIEAAGEFLVMAATLMEIKSRTLMPPDERGEPPCDEGLEAPADEPADPRYELVQQLLEYQRFRLASEALQQRRNAFMQQYPARPYRAGHPDAAAEPRLLELDDAHVFDLYEAYERIIASIDFDKFGDHRVEVYDTPAAIYQQELLDRLSGSEGCRLTLQEAFGGRDRVHRIGLFLAMLELVRLRRITIMQEDLAGEIMIALDMEEVTQEAV